MSYDEINLDSDQRENVSNDIIRWKLELEMDNHDFGDAQLNAYSNELEDCTDSELCQWWLETVGEWVASRRDCIEPPTVDFETYIDYQLGLVIDGRVEDTDYGFVVQYP